MFIVNRVVDVSFLYDMFLTFYMGYYDENKGAWERKLGSIRTRYLRSWFAIDIISVTPFELVGILADSARLKNLKALRIIRLLRLFKLLRIVRASRIFRRIESGVEIDYASLDLTKFLVMVIMSVHWMACAFSLVQYVEDSPHSWMHFYYGPNVLNPRESISPTDLYALSLYWSIMTSTTIGYGDVTPQTNAERAVCIVCMLIGGFMFGYVIGAVGGVLATQNIRHAEFCRDLTALNEFMSEGRFPLALSRKLREFFKWRHTLQSSDMHRSLLERMSPSLRGESVKTLNRWVEKVTIFKSCSAEFITAAMTLTRRRYFPPGEMIVNMGQIDATMYIVKVGLVAQGGPKGGRILRSGGVIGEELLYKRGDDKMLAVQLPTSAAYDDVFADGAPSSCSAYSLTYVELYTLDRQTVHTLLARFPAMRPVREHTTRVAMFSTLNTSTRMYMYMCTAHRASSVGVPPRRSSSFGSRRNHGVHRGGASVEARKNGNIAHRV